ncbi:peptidoglycan-binding protein [Flexivirga meconopsidis]|uniref:C40 family peptidase n=1 Tax=Flexivirga meconopsidis TaxID=2977121 RepID=UPI00223EE213
MTSRKGLVLTGSMLSIPATAASLVHAAPAQADPGSGSNSATSANAGGGTRVSAPTQVVYLRSGSTGSYVRIVQQRLGGLAVDGIFGWRTNAKVKSFQSSKGLVPDGIVGPLTWNALGGFPGASPAPTPTPQPTPPSCSVSQIRYGSTGSLVSTAQQRLGGLAVDGIFGAATLAKVKSFQASKGLVVDGIVGTATWSALGGYPCGSPTPTPPTPTPKPPSTDPPSTGSGLAAVISIARKYLGTPYVWGGASPSQGFDCSGLTSYVYKQAGLYIPRTASQQQTYMKATNNPQPGDLVFFGYPAYHVGIYIGNNQMIASPKPGDVVKQQQIWTTPAGYGTLR